MPARVRWTPRQLALFEAGKQPQPRKRIAPAPERSVHIAVADLLRRVGRPDVWWSHIPSGELRTLETGRLLKRMGLRPGIPDFLFIFPDGRHYWLELKRGQAARLNPAQLEFQGMCKERRISHAVARSFDEAVSQCDAWGVLRPGVWG